MKYTKYQTWTTTFNTINGIHIHTFAYADTLIKNIKTDARMYRIQAVKFNNPCGMLHKPSANSHINGEWTSSFFTNKTLKLISLI